MRTYWHQEVASTYTCQARTNLNGPDVRFMVYTNALSMSLSAYRHVVGGKEWYNGSDFPLSLNSKCERHSCRTKAGFNQFTAPACLFLSRNDFDAALLYGFVRFSSALEVPRKTGPFVRIQAIRSASFRRMPHTRALQWLVGRQHHGAGHGESTRQQS